MNETKNILQKGWVVALLATVCCFLWGSAFPCVKIGYSMFQIAEKDTASQILFAGTRFFFAGILTVFIGSLLQKKFLFPKQSSVGMIVKLSLAQTVLQYFLFYIGLANTSGVKASIIEASNVFLAIFLSTLIFKYEKLESKKVIGCLLGFLGVIFINFTKSGINSSLNFLGDGFIFLSAISSAVSSVLIKKYSQRENTVALSGYQFMLGGFVMMIAGFAFGGRLLGFTLKSTLLLFYLACISAIAYSLWGILLKHNPVSKVTIFGFMNPIFGVILSALFLREHNQAFTIPGFISLLLVCVGIYLVNQNHHKTSI